MCIVHQRQVKIRIDILTEMYKSASLVRVKRRFDIAVFTDLGEHLLEHRLTFSAFSGTCHVINIKTV